MSSRTESIEALRSRLLDPTRKEGGEAPYEYNDLGQAVDNAVRWYSRDRPRSAVGSVTGTGSHYYTVSTAMTSWVRGFSVVTRIDYPASGVSEDSQPNWLDERDHEIFLDATDTEYLYLPVHAPGTSEWMRVFYGIPHTHTDSADTIYEQDLEAVRDLAAGLMCNMLATRAAGAADSNIDADSSNRSNEQKRYNVMARAWFAQYRAHMGLPRGAQRAGCVMLEWPSERGERVSYIFH